MGNINGACLHVIDCHALKQFVLRSNDRKHLNFITKVMKHGTMFERENNEEHCKMDSR